MEKKTKRRIVNIVFIVALVIIYGLGIFGVVTKFTNGVVYLGNIRFDVVLTDSMSERNPNHLDFLDGTTQLQINDMVVGEKINENTELKVKDCVLFKSRELGGVTVVHRIVSISQEGIEFTVNSAFKQENLYGTTLINPTTGGTLHLGITSITDIEIVAYSPQLYEEGYFAVYPGRSEEPKITEIITTKVNDYYKHIIRYHHDKEEDISNTIRCLTHQPKYIESVKYVTKTKGTLTFSADEFVPDAKNNYKKYFDAKNLYEIRADKAYSSDGVYRQEDLLAKVINIIPKFGIFTRFLTSIPGIILIVGLGVIITVASYLINKISKKKEALDTPNSDIIDQPVETKDDDSDKGSGG